MKKVVKLNSTYFHLFFTRISSALQTTAIQSHRQSVTSIVYCQSATNDLTSS